VSEVEFQKFCETPADVDVHTLHLQLLIRKNFSLKHTRAQQPVFIIAFGFAIELARSCVKMLCMQVGADMLY
jgi:hypothetical protein